MSKKSEADLALSEKKDVVRTVLRLKHRLLVARELNDLEDLIEQTHEKEVASGKLTKIDVDSIGIGEPFRPKEISSGNNTGGSSSDEAGND